LLLAVLIEARTHGCTLDMETARFFAAHDDVRRVVDADRLLIGWRRMLFSFMFRDAARAVASFHNSPYAIFRHGAPDAPSPGLGQNASCGPSRIAA